MGFPVGTFFSLYTVGEGDVVWASAARASHVNTTAKWNNMLKSRYEMSNSVAEVRREGVIETPTQSKELSFITTSLVYQILSKTEKDRHS